ncbi:MAG: stress response translation initiation inhibitor YciH [Chloroflexi bacterium]|nr:MAG: stress response translation initiation inhibitor YciH [Chloroflexota bacterium]
MSKKIVYSTRDGDKRKKPAPTSGPAQSLPPGQQKIRVRRETKGRKGKTVTVVTGFTLTAADLSALAKTLKSLCGSGGTTKFDGSTGIIELQGDHRQRVVEQLKALGYPAKLSGG